MVCPFWVGYLLANPLRRLRQNPIKILSPFVTPGMTVLEVGSGMGFFTLPMAEMVGSDGEVVCVDVQTKMLEVLQKRAVKAQLAERIDARACGPASLGIGDLKGKVDFVLAFAVIHEVPDGPRLFREIAQAMKPNTKCLVAEPRGHVSSSRFEQSIATAARQGLHVIGRPSIRGSRAAVLCAGSPRTVKEPGQRT